jgi:dTDP-4-dehydrorhamnose 3,5-epimerase
MDSVADTGARPAAKGWEQAKSPPPALDRADLPAGVELRELRANGDERGVFTELFRREWGLPVDPVQWNIVHSEAGVLRGVHVHPVHDDYLTVVAGCAAVGLRDLRPDSPTAERVAVVKLRGRTPTSIAIPHGVAHGFLFLEASTHCYAVSHSWHPEDELGCRWDDRELEIPWPRSPTLVSDRDQNAPSLAELRAQLAASD